MPCVLIVEDDTDLSELLNFLLTANGYETMCARNGLEALAQMKRRKPCLVLLDMHMPLMDGWEFRRQQLHDPSHAGVPVVAVTAHYDPREVERQLGVRCLAKPMHINDVIVEVQHACGGSSD